MLVMPMAMLVMPVAMLVMPGRSSDASGRASDAMLVRLWQCVCGDSSSLEETVFIFLGITGKENRIPLH